MLRAQAFFPISHQNGAAHNGPDRQPQRIMDEFDLLRLEKPATNAFRCETNNCVKLSPIALVQGLVGEYIGAKFGVVG